MVSNTEVPEPVPSGLVDRLAEALYIDGFGAWLGTDFDTRKPKEQEPYRRCVRVMLRTLADDPALAETSFLSPRSAGRVSAWLREQASE